MKQERYDIVLRGCRPEPLAAYLKALGVLRLVSEQKDRGARGFWAGEAFVLRSTLDEEGLLDFFANEWRPTPVIAPWNGGSGFYPKDNREAAEAILASHDARLATTARSIRLARELVAERGWTERPADEDKAWMIAALRARLPDEALAWLDAAIVLGEAKPLFPPLLGTGGNDGRLDFSNNFQQRVVEVLKRPDRKALASSLLGTLATSTFKGAMGQYLPAANARSNPWDFVLLIEGAMVFAAAVTRQLESAAPLVMAFPFHARAAGGLATVVESDEAESRDELWLPLWSKPATYQAVRHLFAEGRATVGRADHTRTAATGLDFARAVSALGVDRGIDAFCRMGFHVRNGLAYYATPLGRFATGLLGGARLLDELDDWFERLRQKTSGGKGIPSRVAVARRRLEQAMFEAARSGELGPVLLALGDADKALAASLGFSKKSFLRPAPRLSAGWSDATASDEPEYRLAASLARRANMRRRVLPLEDHGHAFGRSDDGTFLFHERPLVDNLHELLHREALGDPEESNKLLEDASCTLSDLASFIEGRTDDALIERWLRGLLLLESPPLIARPEETRLPPAAFALLTLVQPRHARDLDGQEAMPRTEGALALACSGRARDATAAAIRRLNARQRPFPVPALIEPAARMRRIAAALAFPISRAQYRSLERLVLPARDREVSPSSDPVQEHP